MSRVALPTSTPHSSLVRLSRLPWVGIAITVLVLLSALFAVPPIRDAATLGEVQEAHLAFSSGYLALSPLFDVLDTLTLFSVRQHIALLVTALVLYALWRAWPTRRARAAAAGKGRLWRDVAGGVILISVLLVVYAIGAVVPRPMAELVVTNPNVLAVDVHTHTEYSHDGRSGWDAEDVREWHRKAGYDVAYISDHRTLEGAEDGWANNPAVAGMNTVLIPAIEVVYRGEHVNILDAGRVYSGLTDDRLRDVDTSALRLASLIPNKEPVLVETIPGKLSQLTPAHGPGTPGVRAIEIVDGAPRGLSQTRRERSRIVHLADSLNLALVAGSDNHGWGSTAPAWTLFAIPAWRNAPPGALADQLSNAIRIAGRTSTRVVERRVADPGSNPLQLVLAVPIAAWRMLTTLGADQRVMWIVWTWVVVIAVRMWRLRNVRRATA